MTGRVMTEAERTALLKGTPYDPTRPPAGLWGTLGVDFEGNKTPVTDVLTDVITQDETQLPTEEVA